MQSTNSPSRWKRWFRPSRLIPLLTILGAGTAIILSSLKVLRLDTSEEIVIALLALLAGDALSERLGLLENIEARLNSLPVRRGLVTKADIPSVEAQAYYTSEICIVAISAISLLIRNQGFMESKLKRGCNMRIILLDPDSPSFQTWSLLCRPPIESDIRSALNYLTAFSQIDGAKGRYGYLEFFSLITNVRI